MSHCSIDIDLLLAHYHMQDDNDNLQDNQNSDEETRSHLQDDEPTGNQHVNDDDNDNLQDNQNSDEEFFDAQSCTSEEKQEENENAENEHQTEERAQEQELEIDQSIAKQERKDKEQTDKESKDKAQEKKDKNQNTEEGLRNQGSGASSQQLQWLDILKIIGCVVGVLSVIGLCACVPLLLQPSPPCICNDTLISTPPMDLTTTTQMPERYTTTENPSFPTKVITSDPDNDLIKSFTIDILKAVKEVGSSQVDDLSMRLIKALNVGVRVLHSGRRT